MVVYYNKEVGSWEVENVGQFADVFKIDITKLKYYNKNKHTDIYEYVEDVYSEDYAFIEEYLDDLDETYTIQFIDSHYGYWIIKQISEPIWESEYEFVLKQLGKSREQIKREMEILRGI